MMETVDRAGQEEFIWAMRTRALMTYEEDSQSWRESKVSETQQLTESRKEYNVYEQDVKVYASFVPDEIIASPNNFNARNLDGAVLFVEIQGFGELCEKYNKMPKGGTSRLTQVLNSYIGSFVQSIMSFNGDVLKFNGQAVLAFWKSGISSKEVSLPECIHQALDSGLSLLKSHGKYATDIGVYLRTKIIISAGHTVFSLIGNDTMAHFVLVGAPIWESKSGVDYISTGEILISIAAWEFLNFNEFLYENLETAAYVKIYGITRLWRSTQRNSSKEAVQDLATVSMTSNDSSLESEKSAEIHHNVYELRPSIRDAVRQDVLMMPDLRKYISAPVLRVLDMDEGVDNLTEIRNIVVVLFHVEVGRADVVDYIHAVDNCYKCITRVCTVLDGTVNNITFNDKDIHFSVIFGFRGFKHEMDSQRGLYCGKKCFREVSQLPFIKNVTVAITAGLSFCGVIGHNLRREYTAIGLSINRAYKILSIYTNKICCDRHTFFHSKLEASNFILLDSKSLKSISYVGPIYEFIEFDSVLAESKLVYNPFPILDRDREMRTYYQIIHKLMNLTRLDNLGLRKRLKKSTCLIIKGKPRQGKTRLTEEIMYCTPSEFPIFRVKLVAADKAIPFNAIRLIFGVPLGITDKSNSVDREIKLMSKLKHMPMKELLCVLNDVFKVNFPTNYIYIQFSEKQKRQLLKKIIKQLCVGCFPKIWVIVIDGGEFIDVDSWHLINAMAETYTVAIVIAIMANHEECPEVTKMQKPPRYRTLTLQPIDRWFHVGLACQMMNVHGIPAELETMLHFKSNGNPGWVESFLISLLQQNEIQIVQIPLAELQDCPLSIPAKEMMTRNFDAMDNRKITDPSSPAFLDQQWKIFKDSYRDSTTKLEDEVVILSGFNQSYAEEVHEKITKHSIGFGPTHAADSNVDSESASSANGSSISKSFLKQQLIEICQITPGAKLSDVDPEYSIDVRIMKIFDSLTSYEQLILKCSAVIGEYFSREMLLYVMNAVENRKTGIAIQNLFEIGVLGCSGGEFNEDYQNAILNYPRVNPRDDRIAVCRCEGLPTPAIYKEFPKYAFCGYLRFKIQSFREITYDVLTMEQKKDYHSKAMRFLEKKTKKCPSCGGGSLVKLMGVRYDQDLFPKKTKKSKKKQPPYSNRASVNVLEDWGKEQGRLHKSIYYLEKAIHTRESKSLKDSILTNYHFATVRSLRRLRNRESLVRTFSELDYNSCECYRILDSMYTQLIEHCEGADQMNKWLYAVLEYSSLCIDNYNRPLALKILFNALEVLDSDDTNISSLLKDKQSWKLPFIRANIHMLIGKTRYESGQIAEALDITLSALKTYGYNFPYTSGVKMKAMEIFERFKINYFVFPNAGSKEDYAAEYSDNVAECLILVTKIYMSLGHWLNAELAAIFSLDKALQSEKNFPVLVNAYTNVIISAIQTNKLNIILTLETKALLFIKYYKGIIEPSDLSSVYNLYSALFKARVLRGSVVNSIDIGRVVNRIYKSLPYKIIFYDVLPLYVQILMLSDKYLDAVANIIDLGYATHHAEDTGLIWYYALCVTFHLDTGFVILPVKLCENFLQTTNTYYKLNESAAEKRYYTAVWLWYLRTEKYEEALVWKMRVDDCWSIKRKEDSIVNLYSRLYYLEGLILNSILSMDSKNMMSINDIYKEIDDLISSLKRSARTFNVISARLYHLRAWFAMIKGDISTSWSYLKKGHKAAEFHGNTYENKWINHTEMAWTRNMSGMQMTFWRDHAEVDTLDYRELEDNECNLAFYTFEAPIYQ